MKSLLFVIRERRAYPCALEVPLVKHSLWISILFLFSAAAVAETTRFVTKRNIELSRGSAPLELREDSRAVSYCYLRAPERAGLFFVPQYSVLTVEKIERSKAHEMTFQLRDDRSGGRMLLTCILFASPGQDVDLDEVQRALSPDLDVR